MLTHAPGCYDGVTARLVERAGFDVAYLSGAATSAVVLGEPDMGFIGRREMVEHGGRIARRLSIPLIADADTGYGNAVHAEATARAYAAAGIAGFHIEDQVMPKRCGHMAGKELIDAAEATSKVRAAVAGSRGACVVIARTDAYSVEGLDAAIRRARSYHDAGADLLFVEGVQGADDLAAVHEALPDAGLVFNRSEAAATPDVLTDEELVHRGVRLVIHPVSALLAAARAALAVYTEVKASGRATAERMGWGDLNDALGLPDVLAREAVYQQEDRPRSSKS